MHLAYEDIEKVSPILAAELTLLSYDPVNALVIVEGKTWVGTIRYDLRELEQYGCSEALKLFSEEDRNRIDAFSRAIFTSGVI